MIIHWIFVVLFASVFGSFINVIIARSPLGQSLWMPPSHCVFCKKKLALWHNIPIISYIFLRGKCFYCNEHISPTYILVELTTIFLVVSVFYKVGFSREFFILFLVFPLMLSLSVIDYRFKAVPDSINLLVLSISVLNSPIFESLKNALLLSGGICLLRFYVSFAFNKEAMGEGDIIFVGAMGAILGIKLALLGIFLGSLIAIVLPLLFLKNPSKIVFPFIPFLFVGTYISYMFGEEILFKLGI